MLPRPELAHKLEQAFEPPQAVLLAEVITEAYTDLVKTGDFNELKAIVRDLAQAQQRTELRVEELAQTQKELAQAQQRTELRVEELAQAQQRTELRVGELAQSQAELAQSQKETQDEIKLLARRLGETNSTLGGLGQSVAYALENEAYRLLPKLLAEKYNLTMSERLVRTTISGEEVNLFGRAEREGEPVLIVGETKARLDERRKKRDIFDQLAAKTAAVQRAYGPQEIVPIIITHFAHPRALKLAEEAGVIVVQSFEW